MRIRFGGFLMLLVLVAALLGGWLGDRVRAQEGDSSDDVEQLIKTFTEAFATIQSRYSEKVDSQELVGNAVRGLLRTLDPHSSYFAAADYSDLQEEQQGQYFGLGISIRPERPGTGRLRIVQPPADGTPAARAGLRHGDIISKVRNQPIDDWTVDEVISQLKGPKGTKVNITIERPGESEPMTLDVERDAIPIYSIRYAFHVRPQVGYIRIDRFAETTGAELERALTRLGEESLQGLILDLRNNPGGSLSQALAVSDQFLEKGQVIVSTRGRDGVRQENYRASRGRRHDYPLVVLINGHSASASEIVSGALQDHDRALIVGETSFGKALVQTVYPLRGRRGLALTTGKYYTPSNRLIQRPYNEGFYDYFTARSEDAARSEAYSTDSGRQVFAGGGITPDVIEETGRFSRLVTRLSRRSLFYKFAGRLTRGEVKADVSYKYLYEELRDWPSAKRESLKERLQVSKDGRTMDLFLEYASQEGIKIEEGEPNAEDRRQIANQLQREVFLTLFGESEAMKVHLDIDNQVQKAFEILPDAGALAAKAKIARADHRLRDE